MRDVKSSDVAATVIVPTTGNRVDVLKHSIPSILAQSEKRIEVKVVGDGAAPETRALIAEYFASDPRIEFVDKPKHPRRGEPYRHDILQTAKGRIVCYLCDRDLMLPNHVEHMGRLLEEHDFAHSARIKILEDDTLKALRAIDLSQWADRFAMKDARIAGDGGIPLSCAAHTLDAYHRLTEGWSRTPVGFFTDVHMWWKFLQRRDISAVSDNATLTILYFPRYPKAQWPTDRRAKELVRWSSLIKKSGWQAPFENALTDAESDMKTRKAVGKSLNWLGLASNWYRLHRRLLVKIVAYYVRAYQGGN